MASKFIGGDIIELVCNHPTLGDFRFQPKAGESFSYDPGGVRSEDDDNGLTGAGTMIDIMKNTRWSIDVTAAVDFINDTEMPALTQLANSPDPGVWTSTHISGDIRKGTGKVVGEIKIDTDKAQVKFKAAGGGKLEKIA